MIEFEEMGEPEDWELLELDDLLEDDIEAGLDQILEKDSISSIIEEDYEGPSQEFRGPKAIRAWRIA